MSTALPLTLLRLRYEKSAQAYLRSLPLEHFMEATPQATQRKITLASLDQVHGRRSDVQHFNELLIQYPHGRGGQIRKVVPDNLVVVHDRPIDPIGSYDLPLQPVRPFWVLEYISRHSERKDYEDSYRKYEQELKVPYSLTFHPERQELTLYRHNGKQYVRVRPSAAGRYPIRKLELEVGLLDGWVRFWFRGELLPLTEEMQRDLDEARLQLRRAEEQARQAEQQTREAEEQARQAAQQTRQAEEQARQAQDRAERERVEKERLQARLRQLGIDPDE